MADDQDDLAAEWGLALAEQGATPKGSMPDMDIGGAADPGAESGDDMASQWAAMIEDGGQFVQAGNKGGAERGGATQRQGTSPPSAPPPL